MDNVIIGRMSRKGQVIISALIRKTLGLAKGTELSFKVEGDKITIKKLPIVLDWASLIKQAPVENVGIDKEGHYDPRKSPKLYDRMVNG